jgi:hypothetical protein
MAQETTNSGIRNCPWGFNCDKTWESLIATDGPSSRYCDACDRDVYYCSNQKELAESVILNRCVAFNARLLEEIGIPLEADPGTTDTSKTAGKPAYSAEDLYVIGEVQADYYENSEGKSEAEKPHTPITSPSYPTSHDSLTFGEDGGLYMETEFHISPDRESATWIEAKNVPRFLETLGLSLPDDASDKDKNAVLRKVRAKIHDVNDFKKWLGKHKIRSRYSYWPGSD